MTTRSEQIASKAMGAAKAVKATMTGLHGVFKRLTEEHGEVSALLMRLKLSKDPSTRAELFPTIRKELLSHEESELREVYAIFSTHSETARIADHHATEASELREQIERMTSIAVDSPAWQPNVEQLVELVNAHAKAEESTFFPAGQRVFGDRANEMLDAYVRTKDQVMTEL